LTTKYPKDLDVRRLISDIEWWEGRTNESVQEAKRAESLNPPPWDSDPETAIHLAERAHPWRLTLAGDEVWGQQSNGPEFFGLLDYRLEGRDHLRAGYSRLARNYDDGSNFSDNVFHLGGARVQGERSYIEADVTYSPDHNFSPEFSIGVEPHYDLLDDSDVSLLIKYLRYIPEDAFELSPGWRKTFGAWTYTAHFILVDANGEGFIPSGQLGVFYFVDAKTKLGVSYSFGRALEAPYLVDTFNSVGADVTRFVCPSLSLSLRGSLYRATYYTENRLALGADWFF
jgi:YaiO family outer membrane protein